MRTPKRLSWLSRTGLSRLAWFAALWAGGVLAVGALGYAIKLVLLP